VVHLLFGLAIANFPVKLLLPYGFGAAVLSTWGWYESRRQPVGSREYQFSLGRLLFAMPMAVFGAEHFMAAKFVATMIPRWIPAHLFWTYFVGAALIAAALAIVSHRWPVLAPSMLGAMILSFVVLLHIPRVMATHGDRFAIAVLLRDISFSAGAFALALSQRRDLKQRHISLTAVRLAIGFASVIFGVQQFLHSQYVPVIPLEQRMPGWFPAPTALAFVTGTLMVVSGLSLGINWRSRRAATCLALVALVDSMLIYLPLTVMHPLDIANGLNYLVDTLAFSGVAFLLAHAVRAETASPAAEVTAYIAQPAV
jgi:uncharacterized membrane protein